MSKFRRIPNPFIHQERVWCPYVSPDDPCIPIRKKRYVVPPNLFLGFQPPCLPQFPPSEALIHGTLWPILYSPYHKPKWQKGDDS
ncbi:spore coat associated protein CotJA [Thermoactinomyces sp. CICC 10521]|uniref:spore coat associated protein CotJA n=1 Tax=Thermoactinomyces sp. CICC 10521 TaxID=2767426 RepID=UPI0018DE9FB0|nr:spore coat associated protein CotJA [Thermoactinomyces sp. CICC 10521]MBH8606134.1 spore coat associated protein CotJA [Thermoactinomyces sp. CICC 10521]